MHKEISCILRLMVYFWLEQNSVSACSENIPLWRWSDVSTIWRIVNCQWCPLSWGSIPQAMKFICHTLSHLLHYMTLNPPSAQNDSSSFRWLWLEFYYVSKIFVATHLFYPVITCHRLSCWINWGVSNTGLEMTNFVAYGDVGDAANNKTK